MRIGILGAGGMGGVHARHYNNIAGVELQIFDIDPDKCAAFAQNNRATAAPSAEALIESCDAVDVCLPTHLHLPFGMKAIEARKALFMEKPLALNHEEARTLVEAADKANVPFMVGQVVRYFPEFKVARARVIAGEIGTPAAARTRRGGLPPRTDWFANADQSGGILLDLAVHDFDWLRWTLGEVTHVYAKSLGINQNRWPDYALTTLTFECGAVAHVESTWADPGGGRVTFEVCGSKGMIEHDSRKTQIVRTAVTGQSVAMESPYAPADDPYFNQMSAFVSAVQNGSEVPVPGIEGFKSLSIALAAIESAKHNRIVQPVAL